MPTITVAIKFLVQMATNNVGMQAIASMPFMVGNPLVCVANRLCNKSAVKILTGR